mmetsp:Transcript_18844/g.53241  ORF Transcript_18844/g.53241 Transcript_18844/m.53241 type:complete len:235 (+) Transcript_18844:49-753(+)
MLLPQAGLLPVVATLQFCLLQQPLRALGKLLQRVLVPHQPLRPLTGQRHHPVICRLLRLVLNAGVGVATVGKPATHLLHGPGAVTRARQSTPVEGWRHLGGAGLRLHLRAQGAVPAVRCEVTRRDEVRGILRPTVGRAPWIWQLGHRRWHHWQVVPLWPVVFPLARLQGRRPCEIVMQTLSLPRRCCRFGRIVKRPSASYVSGSCFCLLFGLRATAAPESARSNRYAHVVLRHQ